uniref:Sugar phosphate phosphatase n=1 Tax=Cyprinus carpio TaxID=7962 RepID=A0A8C2KL86_CYPCA
MEAEGICAPLSLSAKFEGSFAYLTVRDRLPTILTKVIDTLHRNKDNFFKEYGEEGIQAEKRAISFLSRLRNELQTDKPVLALTDNAEDTEAWNEYMRREQDLMEDGRPVSWFKSPWLYVECYMYRRIQEALYMNPPMDKFDMFKEGKTQSRIPAFQNDCLWDIVIRTQHQKLGKSSVSLWGNKCDLSISGGQDNSQKSSPIDSLPDLQRFILVDNSSMVWSVLVAAQGSRSSGIKNARLVTDLVLASFLVSAGLAKQIRFHGKSIPWFVSDVTKQDFEWTIMQTVASNHKWMSASGVQWKHFMKEGTWSYHDHSFWTLPHEFCDMAVDAADLYSTLQGSDLILFKGDLNYRKLTGDRKWEHTVPFDQALRGFQPAPLCSLRTLKADVQVGLQPGQAEKLSSQDPDWMTNSKYAVVQFCGPHREQ